MEFRFTLNPDTDNEVIDDPKGWDDADIMIERDHNIDGLFIEFITKLSFHGSGYTFLKAKIDADPCQTVDIKIELKCNETAVFEDYYDGIMYLIDSEVDLQRKEINLRIDSANLESIIKRNKDAKIRFPLSGSGTTTALDGVTVIDKPLNTDVAFQFFTEFDGFLTPVVGSIKQMKDAFRFLIEYITNDQMAFTSDFLSGSDGTIEGRPNLWNISINIGTAIDASDVITTEYVNFYGITQSVSTTWQGSVVATFTQHRLDLLIQDTGTFDELKVLTDWNYAFWARIDPVDFVGDIEYDLESWIPFRDVTMSISGGAFVGTITVTETQTYRRGIVSDEDKTGLISGYLINFERISILVSFAELFEEMKKQYNLLFRVTDVAGKPTMSIEKAEDLFGTTPSLTLSNIPDLSFEFFKGNLPSVITLGDSSNTESKTELCRNESYSTGQCGDESKSLSNSKLVFDNGASQDVGSATETGMKERVFYAETLSSAGGGNIFKQLQVVDSGGTEQAIYMTNFLNQNVHKIEANLFSISADTLTRENAIIQNNSSPKLKKIYGFDFPLSKSDFDIIRADVLSPLEFSETDTDHIDGWIDKIKYNIITGLTEFKLLAE